MNVHSTKPVIITFSKSVSQSTQERKGSRRGTFCSGTESWVRSHLLDNRMLSSIGKTESKHQRRSDSKLRALGKVQPTNKQKGMQYGEQWAKTQFCQPSALEKPTLSKWPGSRRGGQRGLLKMKPNMFNQTGFMTLNHSMISGWSQSIYT